MPELYLIISNISKRVNIRTLITSANYFGATILIAGQRNFDSVKHIPTNLRSEFSRETVTASECDLNNHNITKDQKNIQKSGNFEDQATLDKEEIFRDDSLEQEGGQSTTFEKDVEEKNIESLHFPKKGNHERETEIPFQSFENLRSCEKWLQERNIPIVGIEILEGATSVEDYEFSSHEKLAIMLGNEGDGMSKTQLEICRESGGFIYIPQYGKGTCSLNVAIAATIIMHRWHVIAEKKI